MGIRFLVVHGDFELVINQVRDKISARNHYFKTLRNRVWDLLEYFLEIKFILIPRKYNKITNALVGKGAHFNTIHNKKVAVESKFCVGHMYLTLQSFGRYLILMIIS